VVIGLRVTKLEELQRAQKTSADAAAASIVAGLLHFPVDILVLPDRRKERRALAGALKARGWSSGRIARALGCAEKTVQRWLK